MVVQSAEQPSPATLLPSSQLSLDSRMRLPQEPQGCPGTGQTQSVSIAQVALQPSPATGKQRPPGQAPSTRHAPPALVPPLHLPPSSQASLLSRTPLPQRSQGLPGSVQV